MNRFFLKEISYVFVAVREINGGVGGVSKKVKSSLTFRCLNVWEAFRSGAY